MTWLKLDDKFSSHPKVRRAGLVGRALWVAVATSCAGVNSNGVVDDLVAADAAHLADVKLGPAAAALVASGLWHDADTIKACPSCKDFADKLEPGWFYIHDWLAWQYSKNEAKDPAERRRRRRRTELMADKALREEIQERDGERCRYCGRRVSWQSRRGPSAATYDHVDPDRWNDLDNVVTACNTCNGRKGQRTPAEWIAAGGVPLSDPPADPASPIWPVPSSKLGLDLDQSQVEPGSDPTPARPSPSTVQRARSGLNRTWSEAGSGQVGDGGREGPRPKRLKPQSLSGAVGADVPARSEVVAE